MIRETDMEIKMTDGLSINVYFQNRLQYYRNMVKIYELSLEGKTYEEIAVEMDMSPTVVNDLLMGDRGSSRVSSLEYYNDMKECVKNVLKKNAQVPSINVYESFMDRRNIAFVYKEKSFGDVYGFRLTVLHRAVREELGHNGVSFPRLASFLRSKGARPRMKNVHGKLLRYWEVPIKELADD